jgi:hypothetical protein
MRFTDNRLIAPVVGMLALAAYWPIARIVENNFQAEVLRIAQATVMTVMFALFVMALRRAFGSNVPDSARRFYLGLTLWSCAAGNGALLRLLWRMAGGGAELDWMLTSDSASFLIWMEIVGGFFMISGPAARATLPIDAPDGPGPDGISWLRIGITVALCVVATYVVTIARFGTEHLHTALALLRAWIP